MRAAVALLLLLATAHAAHRGKAYVREKVCHEYRMLGKENFRTLTIITNSQKYSNGTFEEISHLVRAIVSLAETCCADGASPSCYDAGSSALSVKSCSADSPFPTHPGTAECCTHEGLERKLCLAALRHPPQPLPRYLQPSDQELCQAFRKDPQEFADSYLASLAQKVPTASFEDLFPLAEGAAEVLSQCCDSVAEDCMQKKLSEHTAKACATLSAQDGGFASCCKGKNLMENYFCILALPPAPAPKLPEAPEPTNKELCGKDGGVQATRSLFELARRQPSLPDAILAKLYDASEKIRGECCSAKDPSACLDSKRQQMGAELPPVLEMASQLCEQYTKLYFLDFKKRLRESLTQAFPEASTELLEQLLEQRVSFASTCCSSDAPPLLCASKVSSELGEVCKQESCLLG
ncbi:Vitamin D-binding protein [Pitangus sulphuratus]|nr:Vitamin D-binding protein [Pitangus sulphuratus]